MSRRICLALAVWLLAGTVSAEAAGQCGPRDKIAGTLGNKYQESRQALGLIGTSQVLELFVSSKGTWTMLATNTSGLACIIAAGNEWQSAPLVVAGSES